MKRVKLKALGISYSQSQTGAYALLLAEENGDRKIPIIIGGLEAQAIVIKLENLEPPRPLTHDLFKNFALQFNITISEVIINKVENGVFYASLKCSNGEKEYYIDSRTSDAVALALCFGCPIYIDEEVMDKVGKEVDTSDDSDTHVVEKEKDESNKYCSYTEQDLLKMIEDAVKTEDYEKAAKIRDEIDRRKKDITS